MRVECNKWDDCLNELIETYIIYPFSNSCNCIATKRECKHLILSKAILEPEFVNEMHHWRWDEKNSWSEVFDIPEVEEILLELGVR
jgi:hypothetical protein